MFTSNFCDQLQGLLLNYLNCKLITAKFYFFFLYSTQCCASECGVFHINNMVSQCKYHVWSIDFICSRRTQSSTWRYHFDCFVFASFSIFLNITCLLHVFLTIARQSHDSFLSCLCFYCYCCAGCWMFLIHMYVWVCACVVLCFILAFAKCTIRLILTLDFIRYLYIHVFLINHWRGTKMEKFQQCALISFQFVCVCACIGFLIL